MVEDGGEPPLDTIHQHKHAARLLSIGKSMQRWAVKPLLAVLATSNPVAGSIDVRQTRVI